MLGQNPTEDEVVQMVMKVGRCGWNGNLTNHMILKANCEWEDQMKKSDFLGVGLEIVQASCDQMEDVKAAFKVFDHNNDGSISRDELREAMINFGTRFTDE